MTLVWHQPLGVHKLDQPMSDAAAERLAQPLAATSTDRASGLRRPGAAALPAGPAGAARAGRGSLKWSLAERRRQHVHHRVDAAELPVRHEACRTARPYKLALTKSGALFEHELRKRDDDRQDLVWVEG